MLQYSGNKFVFSIRGTARCSLQIDYYYYYYVRSRPCQDPDLKLLGREFKKRWASHREGPWTECAEPASVSGPGIVTIEDHIIITAVVVVVICLSVLVFIAMEFRCSASI